MKKINKYLIENYPQLWNTRIVWVVVWLFVIHLIYYFCGAAYFDDYEKLHHYRSSDIDVTNGFSMSFSILTSVLFIIIWLVFYLRNNPFKSFYPLRKAYFFTEFCIQFLIFLGAITFYKSYSFGFWNAVKSKTADVNLKEEVTALNLSYAFIPVKDRHTSRQCCDSTDYIDSLQNIISDTGADPNLRQELRAVVDTFKSADARDHHYSYLNYCELNDPVYPDSTSNQYTISRTIRSWLLNGKKDSVLQTLKRLQAMCERYKIGYNINIPTYADTVFANKDFSFSTFISDRYIYAETLNATVAVEPDYPDYNAPVESRNKAKRYVMIETGETGYVKAYLDYEDLYQTLHNVHLSRSRKFDLSFWLLNWTVALSFTILLFTFRLTATKTWFIALVGSGVLLIACALYAAIIGEEAGIYFSFITLIVSFYGLYWLFRKAGRKILSGINLIWFTWSFHLIPLFTNAYLLDAYRPERLQKSDGTWYYTESPLYDFIRDYQIELFLGYFIISFLVVSTLLYRNYRHWQAMPEE